jgi:PAS domain S-box-containing protein
MKLSPRIRFILYVTSGYLIFGSIWIFLSDRLLMAFTDISAIAILSTAKGIAFIILTALLLILALRAVPDRETAEPQSRYRTSEFLILADQMPRWVAYAFAVAVTLAMLFLRMRIAISFDERPMLILFMPPIILSSVLGGFGPGIIATAVAAIGIDYFGIPPLYSLHIGKSHDIFQWFMLITSGVLSSFLSELLHRARRKSEERRLLQEIAQDELKHSELRFRTVARLSSDFAYSCQRIGDGKYMVDWITDTFYVLTGISEAELKDLGCWMALAHPEDRETAVEPLHRLQPGDYDTREFRIVTNDGRILTVANHMECEADPAAPGGMSIYGSVQDITGRKQAEKEKASLEAQLQQSQKMEAIGSLAGSIAHDLNNILFPISSLSEMLLNDMPTDSPEHESMEQIYKAAQRGSAMVKQILAFSRQSNPRKQPIRIQPILEESIDLARTTVSGNIEITSHIREDCGMVSADPTQVHQIMMNLITNACHAVAENGGTIDVALKETLFDKDGLPFLSMPSGRYACISISDTGTGMDQSLIDKIFIPYFTTKAPGKGTGLGLSVVHGIVKEHGGDIRVYSEAGKGTIFKVYLPLLENAGESSLTVPGVNVNIP